MRDVDTGVNEGVDRERGVLLHIGPHKTGTTAIQGALAAKRAELLSQGILYPGEKRMEHNRPAAAAIQRKLGWERQVLDREVWTKLVTTVGEWSGRSILSSEVFCEADDEAVQGIVSDLSGQPLRVVITLRPLEELLPSNWQQYIKSGYRRPYDKWLEMILESRGSTEASPSFWRRNDLPALLDRWASVVPAENITCVIVDRSHPRSLFDSFEQLLELPQGTLVPVPGSSNRSLSLPEVELLRALNRRIRRDMSHKDYLRFVKKGTVLELVENRTPGEDEARLVTPGWAVARARELGREDVEAIKASGVHVMGDLGAQVPSTPIPSDESHNTSLEMSTLLAADFLAAMARVARDELEEERARTAKANERTQAAEDRLATLPHRVAEKMRNTRSP